VIRLIPISLAAGPRRFKIVAISMIVIVFPPRISSLRCRSMIRSPKFLSLSDFGRGSVEGYVPRSLPSRFSLFPESVIYDRVLFWYWTPPWFVSCIPPLHPPQRFAHKTLQARQPGQHRSVWLFFGRSPKEKGRRNSLFFRRKVSPAKSPSLRVRGYPQRLPSKKVRAGVELFSSTSGPALQTALAS